MPRFIVMTSSGNPRRGHGPYRNVAVCETDGTVPKMISLRAKGMVRIVRHFGSCYVGATERCAYQVALREAQALADKLNDQACPALPRPASPYHAMPWRVVPS